MKLIRAYYKRKRSILSVMKIYTQFCFPSLLIIWFFSSQQQQTEQFDEEIGQLSIEEFQQMLQTKSAAEQLKLKESRRRWQNKGERHGDERQRAEKMAKQR